MENRHAIFLVVMALAATPAGAGMLYKSVAPDGSLMFSDMPPPAGARILEQRQISTNGTIGSSAANAATRTMEAIEDLFDADGAIARASSQVDMAEHALALARREMWSVRDGLRLKGSTRSLADEEKLDFYKRNVLAARQVLMEVLREKRGASRP